MAITEDQSDVIAFLGSPRAHGGAPVERIDTHASVVFLAGTHAWKLKRAVRYDYLDFSTPARRKAMCEAEVRINRRTAPSLYRGILPVTREPGGELAISGTGRPIDWLVDMNRFPQEDLFDQLAAGGALPLELMPALATTIADFHAAAERRTDYGGRAGLAAVVDGNARGFAQEGLGILDATSCLQLVDETHRVLASHGDLLDRRRAEGFVRECHGDLHLRNIVLLDGRPTLFDAIEFGEDIACIDVLYDLAFLLMDLWKRRLPAHANAVFNGYLGTTGDIAGVGLMPLFLSLRAAVRAKTSAAAATLASDGRVRTERETLARDYLRMAAGLLRPPPPCIVAIGGYSGSGKSTLAKRLAPFIGAVPGALLVRSDEVRKRLHGVSPLTRLGAEAYTPEVSRRVYTALQERTRIAVTDGHAAVVDAVFASLEERQAIEQRAVELGVPFVGLWLDAAEPLLIERSRQRHDDPSDADAGVIRMQLRRDLGPVSWHRVDSARSEGDVELAAVAYLTTVGCYRPISSGQ